MAATRLPDAPLDQPDLFQRSQWMVDELADAGARLAKVHADLRAATATRDLAAFDQCLAEQTRLVIQLENMNAALLRASDAEHKSKKEKPTGAH